MAIVISAFDVDPDRIEPDAIPTTGAVTHRLFRAALAGSAFGYVDVAEHGTAAEAKAAATKISNSPLPVRSGTYSIADVGMTESGEADGDPITFINCLSFPAGNEPQAYVRWKTINDYMVRKPGYRSHVLHRRADPSAPFGFVNVVTWESAESLQHARDSEFATLTADLPFVTLPTWCRPAASSTRS